MYILQSTADYKQTADRGVCPREHDRTVRKLLGVGYPLNRLPTPM